MDDLFRTCLVFFTFGSSKGSLKCRSGPSPIQGQEMRQGIRQFRTSPNNTALKTCWGCKGTWASVFNRKSQVFRLDSLRQTLRPKDPRNILTACTHSAPGWVNSASHRKPEVLCPRVFYYSFSFLPQWFRLQPPLTSSSISWVGQAMPHPAWASPYPHPAWASAKAGEEGKCKKASVPSWKPSGFSRGRRLEGRFWW